jgi:hypothetical protein
LFQVDQAKLFAGLNKRCFRVLCERPADTVYVRDVLADHEERLSACSHRQAKFPARHSRNPISDYLPQRRDGCKKKKKYLSELSVRGALAGEMSESEMFRTLEDLPKPGKFSSALSPARCNPKANRAAK